MSNKVIHVTSKINFMPVVGLKGYLKFWSSVDGNFAGSDI